MTLDELLEAGGEVCAAVLNGRATDPNTLELASVVVDALQRGPFVEARSQNDLDEVAPLDPVERKRFMARRRKQKSRAHARGEPFDDPLELASGHALSRSAPAARSRYGHAKARALRVTEQQGQSPQAPLIREAEEKRTFELERFSSLPTGLKTPLALSEISAHASHAERDVTLGHAAPRSRSVTLVTPVTLDEQLTSEQPGVVVVEHILAELERVTGDVFELEKYRWHLGEISKLPANEWPAVLSALRVDGWVTFNPGKCSPAHVLRRWEVYRHGPRKTTEQLAAEAPARAELLEHLEAQLTALERAHASAGVVDDGQGRAVLLRARIARLRAAV